MTNNPTIDGVSREFASRALSVIQRLSSHITVTGKDLKEGRGIADELRALLDAPVVERQPVHEHDCCANCMRPRMEHCGENCPAPETTVWHAWDYNFAPNTKVTPEVAALQSTIAQLQARGQELENGLGAMLFAFDDGVGRGWSEKLLDYARKLTPAVEFDATAALNGERK